MEDKVVAEPRKRDEWEIREDYNSVKRPIEVFKDKERLADVQKMIKDKKNSREALNAVGDGDLKLALGL